MNKTKKELTEISDKIIHDTGQYFFTKKELQQLLGTSRNKIIEMCKEIPIAQDGKIQRFYILDVITYLYT